METEKIRVIIKRPDEKIGHMTNIVNSLKCFQNHVGGHIEVLPVGEDGAVMICNEEGKLLRLTPNFWFGEELPDIVVGTVIICGTDGEEFTDVPFDNRHWQAIMKKWKN